VLLEDDPLAFDRDGQRVFDLDAECTAKLHGNHDAAEVVDTSYDTRISHDSVLSQSDARHVARMTGYAFLIP
jgi:hypothetical protein